MPNCAYIEHRHVPTGINKNIEIAVICIGANQHRAKNASVPRTMRCHDTANLGTVSV
jgi:hypothetical protein